MIGKAFVTPLAALLLATWTPIAMAQQAASFAGEVLESENVENYTYARLKTSEGEVWVAVPKTTLKNGSRVVVGSAVTMVDFESRSLKKRFDRILFGEIVDPGGRAAPPAHAPAAPAVGPLAPVARATGQDAFTVAEVVSGKASLKDRSVLVRAQVVKVSLGILGKNWLHLQDGTGSRTDGSNDILVTTQDVAAVGDIVNARGTVRTDIKLGAGYDYAVVIEDATLRK